VRYQPDESDLLATERKVEALWQAIERALRSGDWRPRPGRICEWCAHQAICPAFGGTPPPLPDDLPGSLAELVGAADEAPPSQPASLIPASTGPATAAPASTASGSSSPAS
jgi:putative RecB family exonuclease